MYDWRYTPHLRPRVCSPPQLPLLPRAPLVPVQVVDVRPEAPPSLPVAPQRASPWVSVRVPAGIHAVPNASKHTPVIPDGIKTDVQMPPVFSIVPSVAPDTPSEPLHDAPGFSTPFGKAQPTKLDHTVPLDEFEGLRMDIREVICEIST